ncbi:MAG: hypothetical protein AVDCRST_MAG49-3435, partial [uncultured Thermomicrobiales bacterium]
ASFSTAGRHPSRPPKGTRPGGPGGAARRRARARRVSCRRPGGRDRRRAAGDAGGQPGRRGRPVLDCVRDAGRTRPWDRRGRGADVGHGRPPALRPRLHRRDGGPPRGRDRDGRGRARPRSGRPPGGRRPRGVGHRQPGRRGHAVAGLAGRVVPRRAAHPSPAHPGPDGRGHGPHGRDGGRRDGGRHGDGGERRRPGALPGRRQRRDAVRPRLHRPDGPPPPDRDRDGGDRGRPRRARRAAAPGADDRHRADRRARRDGRLAGRLVRRQRDAGRRL